MLSTFASFLNSSVSSVLILMNVDSEKANAFGSGLADVISWLDPFVKTQRFRFGVFGVAPLFFCLSMAVFFLYLTFRMLEKKRWSQR